MVGGVRGAAGPGVHRSGTGQLHRLLVAGHCLGDAAEGLGDAGLGHQRHHVAGEQRHRLAVAEQRIVQLVQALLPDLAGTEVGPADQPQLVSAEGHVAQPVEGTQGAERLAGTGAQLAEQLQRPGMVGGELQRRLAVQAGPGHVVLGQRREAGELDVRIGGLQRITGQRREPPVGTDGTRPVLSEVGCLGQRLQRGEVVGADAQERVERLHRHLRGLALRGTGGSLGGGERRGVLPVLARMLDQGQPALGAPRGLAAPLAHHRRGPQRCRAGGAATGQCLEDVEGELVRRGVGHQQRQEPLEGEGMGLLRTRSTEVGVTGLGELAGSHQRLGLGEGAGALQGEEQLLVEECRGRQRPGGKAQPQPGGSDLHSCQPGTVEGGHPEAAGDGGQLHQLGQHPGGESVRPAKLDVGERRGALRGPGEEQRHRGRRRRGEPVHPHVVEVDRQPLPIGVEGDLEGGGDGRRPLQLRLSLQPAPAEVQRDVGDLQRPGGHLLHRAADQLRVDRHLEEAEMQLPPLVALGPCPDVEGKGDVWNLQPEVDHLDAWAQLDRRKADEGAAIQQSQLGPGSAPRRGLRCRASRRVLGGHLETKGQGTTRLQAPQIPGTSGRRASG